MSFTFPAVRRQNSDQWSDCRRTISSGSARAQSLGLKSFWVIHGGLSQDGIVSGSTACCLSVYLHGIEVSAKTPASLRKALAFRAVELSLRRAPRERAHERIVEQVVLPLKEEIAEGVQSTPLKRGPDRIGKQMADMSVPPGMEHFLVK